MTALARTRAARFVRDHVDAWWYWRDWRIGVLIGDRNVKVSLFCLTIELARDQRPW